MQTESSASRRSTNIGYWRDYRVGPVAEAAHVTSSTVIACAVGLAASFASILLIGIAGEEGLVTGFSEFIDKLSRASLGVLVGIGTFLWGLYAVADSLRSVAVSRALVRAAKDGADPQAVPHPAQVESVVIPPHTQLVIFLGLVGFLALLVAGVSIAEHDTGLVVATAALAAVCAAVIVAAYTLSRPAHRRRRRLIAEHWTAHYEQTAWGQARNASGGRTGGGSTRDIETDIGTHDGSAAKRKLSRGLTLMFAGIVSGVLAGALLELFLFVRFPGSVSTPGATLNERGSFSSGIEAVLDGTVWLIVALGLAAVVIAVTGSVLLASGLADEREELSQLVEDLSASRPEEALLARHAGRRPAGLPLIGAGLGAFVLVPSLGVLSLLSGDDDDYSDTAELFSGLHPFAVGGVAVGVLLIVVALVSNALVNLREYPLRDRLQQRWPVLPKKPEDKKSTKYAVRTKPTLRREDIGV